MVIVIVIGVLELKVIGNCNCFLYNLKTITQLLSNNREETRVTIEPRLLPKNFENL